MKTSTVILAIVLLVLGLVAIGIFGWWVTAPDIAKLGYR